MTTEQVACRIDWRERRGFSALDDQAIQYDYTCECDECGCFFASRKPGSIYFAACKNRRIIIQAPASAQCLQDTSPGAPFRGKYIPHKQFMEGLRFACWPTGSIWYKSGATVRVVGIEWLGDGRAPVPQRLEVVNG